MDTDNTPFGGKIMFSAESETGGAASDKAPAKSKSEKASAKNANGKGADAVEKTPISGETDAATEPQQQTNRLSAAAALLGEIVWLLGRSDAHKHIFLTELDWMVMPPIPLRQFRIWRQNNQPVAYASWAFLSDEASQRFTDGAAAGRVGRLAPGEWKSGEQLWLIDFIAPFGGGDAMIKELREKVFAGQTAKTIQRAADGSGISVKDL
ncbi:MAG: cytolysin-activating lysine-acyltransferase [Alphaproteobacteria bacterium]|jgi:cytolysin-activating lysine-acyltransferase